MGAHPKKDASMKKLDPNQPNKRLDAHAVGARSEATICPNWPHSIAPKKVKPKKLGRSKTPSFALARAFRSGHGLYS